MMQLGRTLDNQWPQQINKIKIHSTHYEHMTMEKIVCFWEI